MHSGLFIIVITCGVPGSSLDLSRLGSQTSIGIELQLLPSVITKQDSIERSVREYLSTIARILSAQGLVWSSIQFCEKVQLFN